MNAKIKAQLKAWDRKQRSRVVGEMIAATESGDLAKTRRLLAEHPLVMHRTGPQIGPTRHRDVMLQMLSRAKP